MASILSRVILGFSTGRFLNDFCHFLLGFFFIVMDESFVEASLCSMIKNSTLHFKPDAVVVGPVYRFESIRTNNGAKVYNPRKGCSILPRKGQGGYGLSFHTY